MLTGVAKLSDYVLSSPDGELGTVDDLYFDDRHWIVHYLLADTGPWLKTRQVLISPYALGSIDPSKHEVAVSVTKAQVEGSPVLEADQPISFQFEHFYYAHYGWPANWASPVRPEDERCAVKRGSDSPSPVTGQKSWDRHLRCADSLRGCFIECNDGPIGILEDLLLDDSTWTIRYLVVDTNGLGPKRRLLIPTKLLDKVGWSESMMSINLTRDSVLESAGASERLLSKEAYAGAEQSFLL